MGRIYGANRGMVFYILKYSTWPIGWLRVLVGRIVKHLGEPWCGELEEGEKREKRKTKKTKKTKKEGVSGIQQVLCIMGVRVNCEYSDGYQLVVIKLGIRKSFNKFS